MGQIYNTYFSPLDQFSLSIILKYKLGLESFYVCDYYNFYSIVFLLNIFLLSFFLYKKSLDFYFLKFYANNLVVIISNQMKGFFVFKKQNFLLYYITTFLFILNFNLMGMFPYSFAITSHISFTFFLALSFFYSLIIIALKFKNIFVFSFFYPSGVPLLILPMLIPIEIVSFFSRIFSLSIRLFANIMAGHILLKILCQFF